MVYRLSVNLSADSGLAWEWQLEGPKRMSSALSLGITSHKMDESR